MSRSHWSISFDSTSWVITMTDWPVTAPLSAIFRICVNMSRLRCGSSGEVGSSRNSRLGLVSSSMPMLTRFFWPPDSRSMRVSACLVIDSSSRTSPTRWLRSSSPVSGGKRSSAW